MGKRTLLAAILSVFTYIGVAGQDYVPVPVTVSKEKVKLDGKVYYSHVVLERQTLYGISKAYNVTIEDLYKANESIGLRENGLKKNSIILIPFNNEVKPAERKNTRRREAEAVKDSIEQHQTVRKDYIEDFGEVDVQTEEAEPQPAAEIPADSLAAATPEMPEPRSEVNMILMLPLKAASGRGTSGYMDFYSGAILAARAKGLQGINVNLSVFDVAEALPELDEDLLRKTDVVIGPVFYDNLKALLDKIPESTAVVSPMDPKTESLARNHKNLIQAHGSNEMQYAGIADWIASDMGEGEKLLIIYESGKDNDIESVEKLLEERKVNSGKISYNILEGRSIDTAIKARLEAGMTNRVLIVSDSEAFVNDAIRNLALLTRESSGGYDIALYGPSKIRSFETIEAENLHKTKLHLAMSYNVNYDDPRVMDFLMKYRAVCRTEPSAFAYQGYDLCYFFISMVAKYGDNWTKWFCEESASMLQANFKFNRIDEGSNAGFVNGGLRRIVYDDDYTVDVLN